MLDVDVITDPTSSSPYEEVPREPGLANAASPVTAELPSSLDAYVPALLRDRHAITVAEFAELVGIGRTAAYEAARRNEIPVRRIGSRYVMPVALVMRWLGLAEGSQVAAVSTMPNDATPLREDGVEITGRGH